MFNLKQNVSKLKKITNKPTNLIKKSLITTLTISALAFGSIANANDLKLATVYHVYIDHTYLGIVSDKHIIEDLLSNKLEESKSTFGELDLQLNNDVSFISEQVFRSTANDEQVIEKINNELAVQAEATAILIDNEPVAYVSNEEEAQEVLHSIKLKYVTEEQLKQVEERKANPSITLPALKEDETRIFDVILSEKVTIADGKVSPDNILDKDLAMKLLLKGTLEEKLYKVQEGDVLGSVANGHGLTLKQLLDLNKDLTEDSVLQIGQEINVTVYEPYIHVSVIKEVYKKEAIPFKKEVKENKDMYKGDTKVVQEGENGQRAITYIITEQNGQRVAKEIQSEKIISEPVTHVVMKGTKVAPSRGTGEFVWPTVGGYVSSQMGQRWGRAHKGIDIARPSNRTIKAADNGVVIFAGWDGGYGNKIVIDHQNGYRTVYAHLASIDVRVGQTVPRGSKIGIMGSTGDSTGIHLHFELYLNGALKNPLNHL